MRLISLRNFLFLPLLFFLTIISIYISYKFEINFFIFFVFSLICNFYLLSSLTKQSSFFHFFLAMYIWLGFYFKFIINLLFNFDGSWGEIGSLVNSQFLYNETLLVSIFGIAGFFFSHLFQKVVPLFLPLAGHSGIRIGAFVFGQRFMPMTCVVRGVRPKGDSHVQEAGVSQERGGICAYVDYDIGICCRCRCHHPFKRNDVSAATGWIRAHPFPEVRGPARRHSDYPA